MNSTKPENKLTTHNWWFRWTKKGIDW